MSLAEEIRKLADLHASGALSDDEFAAAKASAIERENEPRAEAGFDPRMAEQIESLRVSNELHSIDRQWDREREQYMVHGKYGHRYEPAHWQAVAAAFVGVCGGGMWMAFAMNMGAGLGGGGFDFFPLFGVVFILFGLGMAAYIWYQASNLETARARYHERRRQAAMRNSSSPEKDQSDGIHIVP